MKIYEIQTRYKAVGTVPEIRSIACAADIASYLKGAFDSNPMQEQFWCIMLNGANKPMARYLCTLGLINQTQIHSREAFKTAIREGAVSVIFSHNHPSGSPRPSNEDVKITERLSEAGKLLDIPVLDHVIIADDGWTSIRSIHPEIFT